MFSYGNIKKISGLFITQGIAAFAAITVGKLTAIYVSPSILGEYNLQYGFYAFFFSAFITPCIQSFKSNMPTEGVAQKESKEYIAFYIAILSALLQIPFLAFVVLSLKYINISVGLLLIMLGAGLSQAWFSLLRDLLNIRHQHKIYGIISIVNAVANLLVFVLMYYFMGNMSSFTLWGVLFITNFLTVAITFQYIRLDVSYFKFLTKEKVAIFSRQLFLYIKPLLLLSVFAWINNYADRYILSYFYSTEQVGYYSVGYGLGSKIALLNTPFLLFLTPKILEIVREKRDNSLIHAVIKKTLLPYVAIGSVACLFLFLEYQWVGRIFLDKQFEPGFKIIPIIGFSFFMLTIVYFFDTKFYAKSTTQYILWHNIVGGVFNIILNILMIPHFGILGAAWATLISFTIQLLCVLWLYSKD